MMLRRERTIVVPLDESRGVKSLWPHWPEMRTLGLCMANAGLVGTLL